MRGNIILRPKILIAGVIVLATLGLGGWGYHGWNEQREIQHYIAQLANRDSNWDAARKPAQEALVRLGKPAVPHLIKLLDFNPRDPFDYEKAYFTTEILRDIGADAQASIPKLILLLKDHDDRHVISGEYLGGAAAEALGKIGIPAIPALTAALHDPDWLVRVDALYAFMTMGSKGQKAIPSLIPMLKDTNPNVRSAATEALGAMGPLAEKAIPDLIGLLGDKGIDDITGPYRHGQVNRSAVCNLALIGKPAVPYLKTALRHPNPEVRDLAKEAIERIRKEAGIGR